MKLKHLFENEVPKITDPREAFIYAEQRGKRIPELEPIFMKDSVWACQYARDVIKGRWPEAEPVIMKDPHFAFVYARDVIKGRWPEAEPYINLQTGVLYARDVIKGRWPKAEPYINPQTGVLYARDVIKGRWPEAEPVIMKDPVWAYYYAKDVIKGRWPEAEPYIMKKPTLANNYLYFFPEARTLNKDVPLVLGDYAIIDIPNTITDEQVGKLIKLLEPNVLITTDQILRTYFEPQIKQELENNKLKQVTTKQLRNNKKIRTQFLKNIDCNFNLGDFE